MTSRHAGRSVRAKFEVGDIGGKPSAARPAPVRQPKPAPVPVDDYERPPLPEEAPPMAGEMPPAGDMPPWEEPAPARDKLDELALNGQQLDGFQIK